MERIARAQALGDSDRSSMMKGQRVLEINPRHPLIKEIRSRWDADPEDKDLAANARLLYESCLMESGFILDDVKPHNERIMSLLAADMNLSDLTPGEEEEYPEIELSSSDKTEDSSDSKESDFSTEQVEEMIKKAQEEAATKDEL
jgi:hypothetical protein